MAGGGRAARADGRDKRDDPGTGFTTDLVREPGTHRLYDQLVVAPDRTVERKDEDELVLAVEQGVFDDDTAAAVEADAALVEAIVGEWGPPFCEGWEAFRPDPAWPVPSLLG